MAIYSTKKWRSLQKAAVLMRLFGLDGISTGQWRMLVSEGFAVYNAATGERTLSESGIVLADAKLKTHNERVAFAAEMAAS